MTASVTEPDAERFCDVAVLGGGLAGLAAATHLARRGLRVICVEPNPWPRPAVGESLEFSAPRLLIDLGIDLSGDAGTGDEHVHLFPKTDVRITGGDEEFTVWPPPWFAKPPIWCSRLAYHTDRVELDRRVMHLAVDEGVEILPERVTAVHHDQERIHAVSTERGARVRARWFIDASGHTCRLIGRALGLERDVLGESRASFWTRIDQTPSGHATSLYFPEPAATELTWVWEIPLNTREISVGVVLPATRLKEERLRGLQPREIFERQVSTIPRLRESVEGRADFELHATTYTPFRYSRPIGPNWLLVGDAAAMVDPLTSSGVTSALRHADLAARTVSDALERGKLTRRQAWAFRNTVLAMVATLDQAIDTFVYRPAVRRRLGLRWAISLYAGTGVITNSLYAKINPVTPPRALACFTLLISSRLWTRIASRSLPCAMQFRGTRSMRALGGRRTALEPASSCRAVSVTEGHPADSTGRDRRALDAATLKNRDPVQ